MNPTSGKLRRVLEDGANPFPGLRSFGPHEDHLFFGREKQSAELLQRLRTQRFIFVVGSSGCGKSSLVHSGLIPSLHGGFMVGAGSGWRVALCRPGDDPIGNLASALAAPGVLGGAEENELHVMLQETTLRSSAWGLVDCVNLAHLPQREKVVVVVDQFEELFRFKRRTRQSHDDAVAFVKRLLAAANQQDLPLYVVATMRSDFIGNCMAFPELPEAVNKGIYVVPRMNRHEIKAAITGPVAVGGGRIAPRLVTRLVNQIGDDPDQLPLLQHALMRCWDRWRDQGDDQIDLRHYHAAGGMDRGLSQHAEEAFAEMARENRAWVAEKIFKALTEMDAENRGIRRPTRLMELCEVAGADREDVVAVIECFRRPGRSFLMPPVDIALSDSAYIDITHESLMRVWARLVVWAEEEHQSITFYRRIAEDALLCQKGQASLWTNPRLQNALSWRNRNKPTRAWTRRVDKNHDLVSSFLEKSRQVCEAEIAEKKRRRLRVRRRQRTRRFGLAIATILTLTLLFGLKGWFSEQKAARAKEIAAASEQTAAFFECLFEGIDPERAEVAEITGKEILDLGLEKLKHERDQHPGVRIRLFEVMARAYHNLGQYEQALWLRTEAVTLHRDMDDPGALVLALVALAHTESKLAHPDKAQRRAREALDVAERKLGASTETAAALDALGLILANQGNHGKAEPLLRRALAMRRQVLGEIHAEVGESMVNLGFNCFNKGDYDEAERLFRSALSIYHETLGASHPDAIAALGNLAALLHLVKGDLDTAESLYRRALELDRERLGEDHPFVATDMANLATLLHDKGDFASAEPLYRQALKLNREMLGANHPDVASDLSNLASLLQDKGDFDAAESLYLQALAIRRKAFGEEHKEVGISLKNLALLHRSKSDFGAAEPFFRGALALNRAVLGKNDPKLGFSLSNLAETLVFSGRFSEAEPLIDEALAIFAISLAPDHWAIAVAQSIKGRILAGLRRFDEVEDTLIQACQALLEDRPSNDPKTRQALGHLIHAYQLAGRKTEAAHWQAVQAKNRKGK